MCPFYVEGDLNCPIAVCADGGCHFVFDEVCSGQIEVGAEGS